MKNNKYLLATVLLLAVVSYFVLQSKNNEVVIDSLLIPELQDKINDVNAVTLSQGQQVLHFYKKDTSWRIKEVNDYFVDANKIAELLLNLRKFKLKQPKTSNPKNYHRLGLDDSQAVAVVLKYDESVFADFVIGKTSSKGQGTYVRKKTDKLSWLAEGQLRINMEANHWTVNTIVDIDSTSIKSVSYHVSNEKGFKVSKNTPADEGFHLENKPTNKQIKSGVDLNALANGLSKFSIDGVADDNNLDNSTLVNSLSYETFPGVVYHLNLHQLNDKNYIKFNLENSDSLTTVEQQLGDWVYSVPGFKFEALNKKLSDIVEDIQSTSSEKIN